MVFSSDDEDEDCCHLVYDAALGNPLILQQIFTHLPTPFLLSACSLVNKFWNREARTFIRDYRICLKRPDLTLDPLCKFVVDFDKLCRKTMAQGRQIPWNGVKVIFHQTKFHDFDLDFGQDPETCSCKSGVISFNSDIKLKYLEISWFDKDLEDCEDHLPLQALFRQSAPHLRTLQVHNLLPHSADNILAVVTQLPKLEEISMSNVVLDSEDEQLMKHAVGRLVECAPNLKRIAAKSVHSFALYPEKSYGLLAELEFRLRSMRDGSLYRKVALKRPKIRKLVISGCRSSFDDDDSNDNDSSGISDEEDHDDDHIEQLFYNTLELLLRVCSSSLSEMVIRRIHPLENGLPLPEVLINLRKLKFTNRYDGWVQGLWKLITSIDYDQHMPNLEELKIVIRQVRGMEVEIGNDTWPDFDPEWGHRSRSPACNGQLKLDVELEMKKIDLPCIKAHFPNLKALHITLTSTSSLGSDPCPLSDICRLWPNLSELRLMGRNNELERNYDADFCGIHQDEVELLRRRKDRYLKDVQIVPIKPSLLTMPNLRKVHISMGFKRTSDHPASLEGRTTVALQFISKVTKLVTLRKIENEYVSDYCCSVIFSSDDDDDYTHFEPSPTSPTYIQRPVSPEDET